MWGGGGGGGGGERETETETETERDRDRHRETWDKRGKFARRSSNKCTSATESS